MKRFYSICIFLLLIGETFTGMAAEWQWSVRIPSMISQETEAHPQAFLWIPAGCKRVKAVAVGQHNMCEETLFENPVFRRRMQEAGIALVWITPILDFPWNVNTECNDALLTALDSLAETSGYDELKVVPIVPVGHSAMATFPWNFAAWNPERALAVISYHGDAPRTNLTGYGGANLEWGRTRNIDGIPGLMVEGEYEWWEARVNPALAFRMMYPESCISFLCDTGRGHFDVADRTADYIGLFLKKAVEYRIPADTDWNKPVALKKLNPRDGWLAERWRTGTKEPQGEVRTARLAKQPRRAKPAPYLQYKGDRHDAFWYFDREMAETTEERYARERGKEMLYLGVEQEGRLAPYNPRSHVKVNVPFRPEADGVTFRLKAVFTDSLRASVASPRVEGRPVITRICGPVKKLDDTTFVVDFYRMGLGNSRRVSDMCLLASYDGDDRYKSVVQELNVRLPYPLTEGRRQYLLFPGIADVTEGTETVPLHATSDCGLPVRYYVKEGPAEVEGINLRLTRIPPRAKFPVKVTVVAWQYGLAGRVQTAEPVERSFYIVRE